MSDLTPVHFAGIRWRLMDFSAEELLKLRVYMSRLDIKSIDELLAYVKAQDTIITGLALRV